MKQSRMASGGFATNNNSEDSDDEEKDRIERDKIVKRGTGYMIIGLFLQNCQRRTIHCHLQ